MATPVVEYSYFGVSALAHADLGLNLTHLDRTIDHTGRRRYGDPAGWGQSKTTCGRATIDETAAPTLTERRTFTYDAAWRAIGEEVDEDIGSTVPGQVNGVSTVPGVDRVVQQVFGIRGVNDAVYRREDRVTYVPEVWDEYYENIVTPAYTLPPDGEFDGDGDVSFYQLSDTQLSVHAVVADGMGLYGRVREELEYEPYGQSRRTSQGDFNRNGEISVQDSFDFLAAQIAGSPAADENDDGTVSVQDIFDFLAEYLNPDATPRDRLSSAFFDNPYGYCGYYGDAETAAAQVPGPARRNATTGAVIDGSGCLYHVRHRVYDPSLGRWLTRDPAGFVDGMNLYEYVRGWALLLTDPLGLHGEGWVPRWIHTSLDVFGFVPGVGTVADLANAALYASEGNYTEAALSAASAVPVVGDAIAAGAKGAKGVAAGAKAVGTTADAGKVAGKTSDEVITNWNDFQKSVSGQGLSSTERAKLWEKYKETHGFETGTSKALKNAAQRGIDRAWKQEKELVEKTGSGTREWTRAEKEELLRTGKVKGYDGHHINNKSDHPDLADNPNNVEFLNRDEHFKKHGENWQNPTKGPLLDREKLVRDRCPGGGGDGTQ